MNFGIVFHSIQALNIAVLKVRRLFATNEKVADIAALIARRPVEPLSEEVGLSNNDHDQKWPSKIVEAVVERQPMPSANRI